MGAGLRGGGGGLGIKSGSWEGGGCGCMGGFHRAVVLVDLALGLRSFCSCGTGELGAGGRGVRPKAVGVLPVAAL